MQVFLTAGAVLGGLAFGWGLPGFQHHLYSEPAFRTEPTRGRRLLALRAFCAVAAAATLGLAVRPDYYPPGPALVSAVFLLVLVALSSTDFDRRRIPNVVTYPAALVALALCWVWPDRSIVDIVLGGGLALFVAVVFSFLRFGGGDLKLVVLIGLLLGWHGMLPAIFYGVIAGGLVAVGLLLTRGRGTTFAYGPYLAAGAAVVLLFPQLA
jgi:leader peptidase (prepilin peptidase)/N-methyltransferase